MSVAAKLAEMWRTLDDEGRLDQMERFFTPEYVRHSEEGDLGLEQFRAALTELGAAFPDLSATVSNVVAEDDRAAYMWSATGTHTAPYLGAPATGRRITAAGITISRFGEDGRIVEDWASWNRTAVLHSLGIIPIDS